MSRYAMVFTLILLLVPGTVSANPEKAFVLPGDAEIEMVWIEPGTFMMGSPDTDDIAGDDEKPQHEVTITQGFYIGKYELTQGQWENVMGTTPWVGKNNVQENSNNPAVYISWEEIQTFIAALNAAEGGEVYRLPTEAEWEYACRAGTTTRYSFGDDRLQLGQYAWCSDNAFDIGEKYAHTVGTRLPNPWGLYDMHGNVWELVQDWYGSYSSDAQTDPQGLLSGSKRVGRGGDFGLYSQSTRSAFRGTATPWYHSVIIGTRLVRTGPAPGPTTVSPASWGEIKAKLHR